MNCLMSGGESRSKTQRLTPAELLLAEAIGIALASSWRAEQKSADRKRTACATNPRTDRDAAE